jgi:tRNA/tmRNA/rRNA uracil-C5-methylase (TrmA/RlmC/RlmD family)
MKLFMRSPQRSIDAEAALQQATPWKEFIPTEQCDRTVGKVQTILTLVKELWQKAIASLPEESELKIWQKKDRHGHLHWHVFDPARGKSVSFASELEMLSWIENLNHLDRW